MSELQSRHNELADFLKTRRAKITPTQVGLSEGKRRRTPGLRREEVAQLAGIGLTWYTWLEQGRDIRVSAQVLESLARVLLLNNEERNHLFALAHESIPTDSRSAQINMNQNQNLQNVLDSLLLSPAYIIDYRWNIIAWNKSAGLFFAKFDNKTITEKNLIWMMFTDDYYKKLFVDWQYHAQDIISNFRSVYSQHINDPWFSNFINELKEKSKEFRKWWLDHKVENLAEGNKKFIHPTLGPLEFEWTSFFVSNNPNLKLIIYTPVDEFDSKAKMQKILAGQL